MAKFPVLKWSMLNYTVHRLYGKMQVTHYEYVISFAVRDFLLNFGVFFFFNSITKQGWPKCWLALQQWPKLLLFFLCKLPFLERFSLCIREKQTDILGNKVMSSYCEPSGLPPHGLCHTFSDLTYFSYSSEEFYRHYYENLLRKSMWPNC